jgi:hypothetical protein
MMQSVNFMSFVVCCIQMEAGQYDATSLVIQRTCHAQDFNGNESTCLSNVICCYSYNFVGSGTS